MVAVGCGWLRLVAVFIPAHASETPWSIVPIDPELKRTLRWYRSLNPIEFRKKSFTPLRWGKRSESWDKRQKLDEKFPRLSSFSTLFKRQNRAAR